MKNLWKFPVGLMILVLTLGACGPSPEQIATMTASAWTPTPIPTLIPYDLIVTVTDEAGVPIAGAIIVLPESGSEEPVQTDEQGEYGWTNLPSEAATLNISASGYNPQSLSQTIVRGPNAVAVTLQRDPLGLLSSEACAPDEKLLYIEDFQDGKAQGWQNITAAAEFAAKNGWGIGPLEDGNQVTYFTGINENLDGLQNHAFDNAVWRLKVQTIGEDGFSFLNLKLGEGANTRYIVQWGAEVMTDLSRLQMPDVGHFSVMRSSLKMKQSLWYFIEFSSYNGFVQVWVDGKKLLDYQDPKPLPAGSIGLEGHIYNDPNTVYYFDNMSICELSAPFQSILPTP